MTFDEFMRQVLAQYPEAIVFGEEDGQVCIGTGMFIDNEEIMQDMGERSLNERDQHQGYDLGAGRYK